MLLSANEKSGLLTFSGRLDISTADELRDGLRSHDAKHSEWMLNLSEVESCDVTALQLLWSVRRSAAEARKPFRVTGCSAAVLDAAAALGLSIDELTGEAVSGI